MGKESLPPLTPEEEREAMRSSAFKFFITASSAAPASVIAQGALIAKSCQSAQFTNPEALGDSLLEDEEQMTKLVLVAERTHQHRGNGPMNLPREMVTEVIKSAFTRAKDYITYSKEDLDYISSDLQALVNIHHPKDADFYDALAREAGEQGRRHSVASMEEAYAAFKKAEQEKAMFRRNKVILKKFGEVS